MVRLSAMILQQGREKLNAERGRRDEQQNTLLHREQELSEADDLGSWNAHGSKGNKTINEHADLGLALRKPEGHAVVPRRETQPDQRRRETRLARSLALRLRCDGAALPTHSTRDHPTARRTPSRASRH